MKKILIMMMIALLSFSMVQAQHKKKKKPTSTSRSSSSSKKSKAQKGRTQKGGPSIKPVGFHKAAESKTLVSPEKTLPNITTKKEEPILVNLVAKDTTVSPPDTALGSTTEVIITSAFKPSLRNAAKINFTAATPLLDTNKLVLIYNIPSQNLFFSYQPVPIKPLALPADSSFVWSQHQYVKAGFGSFTSPYLEAGASFGNGTKSMITAHAKYISAKGSLPAQQYSKAGIDAQGIFVVKKDYEITSKLYWDNNSIYKYGYQPDSLHLSKDSLHQKYNSIGAEVGFENKQPTAYGILYHPQILVNLFSNTSNTKESTIHLKLPVSRSFGRIFMLDLGADVDVTHYTNKILPDTASLNNNLFTFNTSIRFKTPNFKLNLGLIPSWDNSKFNLLPNFTIERKLAKSKFIVEGGWIGYYQKNTYKNLVDINPFIAAPSSMFNTRFTEEYVGLKGNFLKHFTFNTRLSFLKITNAALFINDSVLGSNQDFLVIGDPKIKAIRLKGEINYQVQEKLSIVGGASFTQFTKLDVNDKAYGLLPLEITGAMHWKVLNDLTLKSDVYVLGGSNYRDNKGVSNTLSPAFDVNVSAEFPIMKKVNAWVQFNNILNNRYQRWNQYQVLGFQLLAGAVYSFR